ncbi:MAG TPA: sulfite exporter TauE/SafE family protein [Oculatellaceae cyanobacterium]
MTQQPPKMEKAKMLTVTIVIGLAAGFASGLVGIGGGVIMVPAMVILLGYTQHQAQGTSLAILVPPVGLLAAYSYFKDGYVDIKVALLIAAGFVIGSLLGAKVSLGIPEVMLRRIFAAFLALISVKMFLTK